MALDFVRKQIVFVLHFAASQSMRLDNPRGTQVIMSDNKIVGSGAKKPPAAGKGRTKGSLNKTTKTAKEAIALAAENLGGADRLVAWAKEDPLNERAFWSTIYPKLLPLQVTGEGGGPIQVARIELVAMTK